MAKKTPASPIDAYLRDLKVPIARRTLQKLREQLHELIPGATEGISYRMPVISVNGDAIAGFAFFGKSCGLYPFSGNVIPKLKKKLEGYKTSKGGVTFPPGEPLPASVVKAIIRERQKELKQTLKKAARPAKKQGLIRERVTDAALKEATGRDWKAWFKHLDKAGAKALDHKGVVKTIAEDVSSGWWQQSIAVAYEQNTGKRVVGQTAGAGFNVGVVRTLPMTAAEAWELLVEHPERWLGGAIELDEGSAYDVPKQRGAARVRGEVRVVKPNSRIRMTWQPDGWKQPATLQLTVVPKPKNVALHVHLEKLPDAAAREAMRAHWARVVESLRDPSA